MALYNHLKRRHPMLPVRYRHLDVRCPNHHRPKSMVWIADITSPKGIPAALYACPLCNYREAYSEDHHGMPYLLFYKLPR